MKRAALLLFLPVLCLACAPLHATVPDSRRDSTPGPGKAEVPLIVEAEVTEMLGGFAYIEYKIRLAKILSRPEGFPADTTHMTICIRSFRADLPLKRVIRIELKPIGSATPGDWDVVSWEPVK